MLHYSIQCQQLAIYCQLEITAFEFFFVEFSSIVVAIVCSFSVKNSNARPKAKFFHKVGMVSEGPGRGGVATWSVHGCPLVMVVVCYNTPRLMTTHRCK